MPPLPMQVFYESSTSDINDPDYYSPASDIWSFGGVCLHLAMGFCCPRMQYQVREGRIESKEVWAKGSVGANERVEGGTRVGRHQLIGCAKGVRRC